LNLNELTVAVSLFYIGLMMILILIILMKRFRRTLYYAIAVIGGLLLFTVICFSLKLYKTELQCKAVVTSDTVFSLK
jgi:hypothetical protein